MRPKTLIRHVTPKIDDIIIKYNNRPALTKCGLATRVLGTGLTVIGALMIAYRSSQDGFLSFYGCCFRALAFVVLGLSFARDDRMELKERLLYSLPKFGGFILSILQIVGLIRTRGMDAVQSI
jgi:hypothetical protein